MQAAKKDRQALALKYHTVLDDTIRHSYLKLDCEP